MAKSPDISRFERRLKRLGRRIVTDIGPRVVDTAAREVERAAASRAPVDEGDLRESIEIESGRIDEGGGIRAARPGEVARAVTADADHAAHVEFGTEHAPAQPFMRPTYDIDGPRIVQRMERDAVKAIEREANQ